MLKTDKSLETGESDSFQKGCEVNTWYLQKEIQQSHNSVRTGCFCFVLFCFDSLLALDSKGLKAFLEETTVKEIRLSRKKNEGKHTLCDVPVPLRIYV